LAEETRTALARLRKLIADDPERFTRSYFTRLFTLDPSMRDLFPASLANAASGFHHVVDLVLEVAPEPTGHDEAIEVLAQLGRDHRKYGVTAEHYDLAHRALVVESAMMLGPDWTPDVAAAVDQTMGLITGVMSQAAENATGPAVTRARIVEKFQINRDNTVIRLVTEAPLDYLPGQYVEVQIPQWPREWRMLSPSIPANPERQLEFHVKAVPGGTVSKSIVTESALGDVWSIAQHHGTMTVDPETPTTMIAGGTGLAPMKALLMELCANVSNPPVHLYYGARYPGQLYELTSLQRMAAMNPWLTVTAVSEESTDPWWLRAVAAPGDLGFRHLIGTLAGAVLHDAEDAPGHWDTRKVLIAGSPQMVVNTERRLIIEGARASRMEHDAI
jgi:NAD(P)H-flavin reductase/hemoglobin-like flavoprotein